MRDNFNLDIIEQVIAAGFDVEKLLEALIARELENEQKYSDDDIEYEGEW